MGRHALLSASSSHRWLACPPSARLCENYEDTGSEYAQQGTDAHSLCEHKLKLSLGMETKDPTEGLAFYDEEMEECACGYAEYVLSRVRESWQSTFGGSHNANKVAVLEEGMKYTPISISPEQAQFLETRKFQINEIARIFRVPPHMVGDLEKSSFSNIEQQSLEFVKYTLDPWVSRWEQSMARSLLTPEEKKQYFVKFNVDGLLRGDYQSRMNGYAVGRQNGWMSANDIRELENLDRIPEELGGDLYLINGNMMPLSMSGAAYQKGKEESNENEEVLEVEEPGGGGDGSGGEDSVSERHHRRGKLV